jgi:outer membrane protein assembly factor BamB
MRVLRSSSWLLLATLAACGGSTAAQVPQRASDPQAAASPGGSAAAGPATSWPVYHRDAARTGAAAGLPAAGRLAVAWSRPLDGAVYGQPLIAHGIVVAATENDSVYALNRASGRILWHTSLGSPVPQADQPCGNIDPLGITGTPAYEPATGLVYVVAQTTGSSHVLAGIKLRTGAVVLRRDIPAPDGQPAYDQQRGALAAEDGRVYVAFGGHFGDCGPYVGSIVAVPDQGNGPILSYRVPTARQAGIWATAGPVIGAGGTLYVAAGNGAARRPPYDGSDSVIALSPGLRRLAIFAPATWADDNAGDLDLGSMSPALLADGRILQVGKRGIGYLLNAAQLGGIGGQLAQGAICPAYGGAAVAGTTVYLPCEGGMAAVDVAADQLHLRWRGPPGGTGSPVIGGGAVWVADPGAGTLYELAPGTGQVRYQIGLGTALPHFASPALSGALVLIGTTTGVIAVSGA